jgi:hypothetical protein
MLIMHLLDRGCCKFCGKIYDNMESEHIFVRNHNHYSIQEADLVGALLCIHTNMVDAPFKPKENILQQIYG